MSRSPQLRLPVSLMFDHCLFIVLLLTSAGPTNTPLVAPEVRVRVFAVAWRPLFVDAGVPLHVIEPVN